ncbi:MAG: endolytic transglycosylase MltG [Marinilabiliaceae bacterium]
MSIKKLSKPLRPLKAIAIVALLVGAVIVVSSLACRRYLWSPVLNITEGKSVSIFIPTGATYDDVVTILSADDRLSDPEAFAVMASLMGYTNHVKSGRYDLASGLSARALVSILRSGRQTPVRVTFNGVRDFEHLAGVVSRYVEADSLSLLAAMKDSSLLAQYGYAPHDAYALYLPDSYDVWWNSSPEAWVERMRQEYNKFWNDKRKEMADSIGLTPLQVATLASIVEEESNNVEDQRIIAGLYLNRLRIGMPMQACPTIKFALGDFSLRRVSYADTQVESPYNTYLNPGLPPGPIRITSKRVIDAVLNYTPSDYLYMCARPDGSGRHDFARTLAQHQRNAAKYHRILNRKNIYR